MELIDVRLVELGLGLHMSPQMHAWACRVCRACLYYTAYILTVGP